MAFRPSSYLSKFNSASSSKFIDFYESYLLNQIVTNRKRTPAKTFAPSSFRCDRKAWFRLRGVEPDGALNPDISSEFRAEVGTCCHRVMQSNLVNALGDNWVDIELYIKSLNKPWNYILTKNEAETMIEIDSPPFRFSCDGIINWNNKVYLIELKTLEHSSFESLDNPRFSDLDQVHCYGTLFDIKNILVIYQSRLTGDLKCYEIQLTDADFAKINDKIERIKRLVEQHISPDKLPSNDPACTYCEYKLKCKAWG